MKLKRKIDEAFADRSREFWMGFGAVLGVDLLLFLGSSYGFGFAGEKGLRLEAQAELLKPQCHRRRGADDDEPLLTIPELSVVRGADRVRVRR